jgi:hypothetical protein
MLQLSRIESVNFSQKFFIFHNMLFTLNQKPRDYNFLNLGSAMKHEKMMSAIKSAIENLENSMKALVNRDEKASLNHVWHASADTEYALFLFSIIIPQEESESSSWKSSFHAKQMEIGSALALAQELLEEATKKIEADELNEAYKKTWMAQRYLLEAQQNFEKRRKTEGR